MRERGKGMHWDGTITLGNVITVVSTLFALLGVAWKFGRRFDILELRVNMIWAWFKKHHKIDNGDV